MDKDFLAKLHQRDERTFDRLVLEHQALVLGYLRRMLLDPEEAADLTQDVFLAAFRFAEGFRGDCSVRSWLIRIAQNLVKNRFRYNDRHRKGWHRSLEDEQVAEGAARKTGSPEDELVGRQTEALLDEGLSQLPEEFRECLVLRDLELLSYEEIAEVTGLPVGTVKSRLWRARARLAEFFELKEKPR
jgi:RNA polymerase sigma-70 factor (ECF subfamily)